MSVAVDGGDAWRNRNDFVADVDEPAGERSRADRRPRPTSCALRPAAAARRASRRQTASRSLPVQVPGSGEWTVSLWRRDAAGNADQATASDPVTLRYDPEPPQLAFDAPSASDPTLVSAPVTDKVSGLAERDDRDQRGGLEHVADARTPQTDGSRLAARIDDAAHAGRQLPAARDRPGPGAEPGVHHPAIRRAADGGDVAAADPVGDAGRRRRGSESSSGSCAATASGARSAAA